MITGKDNSMKKIISTILCFLVFAASSSFAADSNLVTAQILSCSVIADGLQEVQVQVSVTNASEQKLADQPVTLLVVGNTDNGISEPISFTCEGQEKSGYVYYMAQTKTDSEGNGLFVFQIDFPDKMIQPGDCIYVFSGAEAAAAKAENPLAVSRKNVSIAVSPGGTVTANGIPVTDGVTLCVPTGKKLNFSIQSSTGYLLQSVSYGETPVPGITDTFLTDEITQDTSAAFSFARDTSQPDVYSPWSAYTESNASITFGQLINNNLDYELIEYGVLYSKTVQEPFLVSPGVCGENCFRLAGKQKNTKGQFGIRLLADSAELLGEVHYTRPYAVYRTGEDTVILYGEAKKVQI